MTKEKSIAVLGLFTGITLLLANTIGFIQVGPLAATIMHLPVIIMAIVYGKKYGAIMGTIFGLISLFRAYTNPTPTSFIMMNPLVSVLPRLAFGYLTGLIYEGFYRIDKSKLRRINSWVLVFFSALLFLGAWKIEEARLVLLIFAGLVIVSLILSLKGTINLAVRSQVTAILATLIHTCLVLGSLYLIYAERYLAIVGGKGILAVILASLVNMLFEMTLAAIIVPPIIGAIEKGGY